MKKKEKITYKKYHYLIILFLTALSAAMMYPMIWTVLTSFKSNAEIIPKIRWDGKYAL